MVPANSGTEAVEAAIKIARAATGRARVLYAEHAFHGLTLGALSINGNDEFRDGFGPLLRRLRSGPVRRRGRARGASSRAATSRRSCSSRSRARACNLPPPGYLPAAQRLCRDAGALFVCDEVQTGHRPHRALPRARALGAASRT